MKSFYLKKKWRQWILIGLCLAGVATAYFCFNRPEERGGISVVEADSTEKISQEREETVSEPVLVAVHMSGAVQNPDRVYYLPIGSRVIDAVEAAGGAHKEADLGQLNLAGTLYDGQKIRVPFQGESYTEEAESHTQNQENHLTNINLATTIELDNLPGIGASYAERIVEYRETYGLFQSIEEIKNVKGIGDSLFEKIKDLITV